MGGPAAHRPDRHPAQPDFDHGEYPALGFAQRDSDGPTCRYHESANGSAIAKNETVITRWSAVLALALVSELRSQWGRDFEAQQPNAPGPSVAVTNGLDFGMPNYLPRAAYPDERRWQVSENLNWLKGRHSVKFGYDFTRVGDKMINLYQGGGQYSSYSTLNDFALDCPNPALPLKGCVATPTSGAQGITGKHYTGFYQAFDTLGLAGKTEFSTIDTAFYVEDSFKPVPNFTLNLKLRYDLQTMPELTGNPACGAFRRGRPNALFAAGDFANPLIYQMELSIEQELFKGFTVTAVYMASRGRRLPVFRDTNLFPPSRTATYTVCAEPQVGSSTACSKVERTFTVPFWTGARPDPSYGYITVADSVINSWYHGFVLQAKKRFSHGIQLQAALTISKAQDNGQSLITFSSSNQPQNPFDLRQDYALSDLDQRKRFTLTALWQPPFHRIGSKPLRRDLDGFQLSGILMLADGRPYSPVTSGNPSPSGITGGLLGVGGSARLPWTGRNIYTYPGAATVDLRLAPEIKFSERLRWQLIAEGFNVFNRVNITGITITQYNVRGAVLFPRTDFRSVSATGTNLMRERQFQLGTRFSF